MVRTYNDSEATNRGVMQPIRKKEKLSEAKKKMKNVQREIKDALEHADRLHEEIKELEK